MTLLEILIAFIIAALSLGLYTRVAGESLQAARVAAHYEEALSRARSHLAATFATPIAGYQGGDDGGGFAWGMVTSPIAVAESAPTLYGVQVTISWTMDGGTRRVVLVTRRLTADAPAQ